MGLLDRLNKRVGFTRSESLVVLFLVGTILFGGAIKLTRELTGADNTQYDYSALDQEFAARAQGNDTTRESEESELQGSRNPSTKNPKSTTPALRKLKSVPSKKININQATKTELMSLPGIGEAMAERIIMYREDHGPFLSVDNLVSVKGIGKKKLENLAPYITTE